MNQSQERMLYWIEQDNPSDPNSYKEMCISEADAIQKQRQIVEMLRTMGTIKPSFQYESDQQALEDFIAVNWASYTSFKK